MTKKSSHAAARRLSSIVMVLLLPIVVLSYFGMSQHLADLRTTGLQSAGIKLVEELRPVIVGGLLHESDAKLDETALLRVRDLAGQIGLGAEVAATIDALHHHSGVGDDRAGAMESFSGLLNLIGERSALLTRSSSGTIYLTLASLRNIPGTMRHLTHVEQVIYAREREGGSLRLDLVALASEMGRADETRDRLLRMRRNGGHGVADSAEVGALSQAEQKLNDLSRGFDKLNDVLSLLHSNQPFDEHALAESAEEVTHETIGQLSLLWSDINTNILGQIAGWRAELNLRAWIAGVISLVSAVLGVGLAVSMFASTLKQLDIVDDAHRASERARNDAERVSSEIVALNQELANNVSRLRQAQDELVKKGKMEQLGQLTATVAHEIRNPLGAIRTSVFLLERKVLGTEPGRGLGVESQIERINNSVTRCDDIITQLLDYSRVKDLVAEEGDLDDWLERVVTEEATKLPAVVSIELALGLKGQNVPFDPMRLQRALVNLVSNAAEAMVGKGTDPTRFAVANPLIKVSSRIEDGYAVISVKDNGPGISAANIERIREPLFTTKSFGTGLGIPAVEQTAVMHGGRLEIDSVEGEGARFAIWLPLSQAQKEKAA